MFMGEYRHNIDAKGRMIIPARFRDELGNRFVVTSGLDGCLRTYTMAQWDAVFEQLKRLPSTKRETPWVLPEQPPRKRTLVSLLSTTSKVIWREHVPWVV